jgi:hypothetical protein
MWGTKPKFLLKDLKRRDHLWDRSLNGKKIVYLKLKVKLWTEFVYLTAGSVSVLFWIELLNSECHNMAFQCTYNKRYIWYYYSIRAHLLAGKWLMKMYKNFWNVSLLMCNILSSPRQVPLQRMRSASLMDRTKAVVTLHRPSTVQRVQRLT